MISQNMNSKCQILSNIVIVTQLVVVPKITYIVKRPIIHGNRDHWYDQISWFDLLLTWLSQHPINSQMRSKGSGIQVLTSWRESGKHVTMKRSRASSKQVTTKRSWVSGKRVATKRSWVSGKQVAATIRREKLSKQQMSHSNKKEGKWQMSFLLWTSSSLEKVSSFKWVHPWNKLPPLNELHPSNVFILQMCSSFEWVASFKRVASFERVASF